VSTEVVTANGRMPSGQWPLIASRAVPVKIGANVGTHSRYVLSQMAAVAVPKRLFWAIPGRIGRLRLPEMVPG